MKAIKELHTEKSKGEIFMNVAFIPVRGGSKSIPLKNIKTLAGKPLVYWAAKAACTNPGIDKVYIATDSGKIRDTVKSFQTGPGGEIFQKLEVIGRSAQSAGDTASTESAMLEFAARHEFDNIILIQATSPMLLSEDLTRGIEAFAQAGTDSVLSAVRQKRFLWEGCGGGFVKPANYDVHSRPRRQEFEGFLVENGAFYITSRQALLKSGNRVSGNIRAVEMDEGSYFEIDEPGDWAIVENLMVRRDRDGRDEELRAKAKDIKLFLTDCDGCLTDGGMYYSEIGDEAKKFNTRDGMGFKLLQERGILTGIITGEDVRLNRRRVDKLGLDFLEAGCVDKASAIRKICSDKGILLSQAVFIGDDLNDLEAVKLAGIGCCPADAAWQVKEAADIVTAKKGGMGVIREVVDFLIRSRE